MVEIWGRKRETRLLKTNQGEAGSSVKNTKSFSLPDWKFSVKLIKFKYFFCSSEKEFNWKQILYFLYPMKEVFIITICISLDTGVLPQFSLIMNH